jgi:hypothetical protein
LTRLPCNADNLAAGHVFDLGLWAAQCVFIARGEMRKGYPSVTGIPLPELERLSSGRYGMAWILGKQRESAERDEKLNTPQTPFPRFG